MKTEQLSERETAFMKLTFLTSFSREKIRRMLSLAGDPEELFSVPAERLCALGIGMNGAEYRNYTELCSGGIPGRCLESMENCGMRFFSRETPGFPERLLELRDPPYGLYVRGELPNPGKPAVSLVGARRCSVYGRESASFFGRKLAERGVQIISGMALGVDGYAQRGSVEAQALSPDAGKSFGILGCGADVCYPRENIGLYRDLSLNGNGLISERPPGYMARPFDFPVRNRLISGLCDVLAVIEAAENSGSLITVNLALDQNKEIFALPGRVGDRLSRGCNELLKSGAHVLTCPEDILQELGLRVARDTVKSSPVLLSKAEQEVFSCLGSTPVSMDELLSLTGMTVGTLTELLVRMEIRGAVGKTGISEYIRLL